MKMIKYKLAVIISVFLVMITGCDFGSENIDPTRQSVVALNNTLPTALTQAAYNQAASANRLTGIFMQHFSGFDAQQVDFERYIVNETSLNNFWNFGLYTGVMKDAVVMMEMAGSDAENQPYYLGIAKVLMAHALGHGTALFGDIPYSEAFMGDANTKPKFDSQQDIYTAIQTLLNEAIALFNQPPEDEGPATDDLIYGGDATKWAAAAHALKARYYMHLTKVSGSASTDALAAIANAFTSNADQPTFNFGSALIEANPLALFGDGRPKTLVLNNGFEALLTANSDPRHDLITVTDDSEWLFYSPGDGLFWAENNSPMPLISYSELKFLEAEAMVRVATGGTAAANTALQEAVASNMDFMGVDPGDRDTYLASIPDISAMSESNAIAAIMDESYVALYAQAEIESWTNFRRTGFPALIAHPDGANANDPSGVLPRRIIYPQNERLTNEANLNAAISNQGGALMDNDTWANK